MSAAARRLHLSQSALSQTVQSLERQLGVQLLLRSSAGVTTTEAGGTLLREARALIAHHDRVVAAVAGDAASPGGLRVGIPLELPADLLPEALADLSAACPLTRVEVSHASSAAQLAELKDGQLDVALIRECPADPRYDAVLAVEEALGVILATARIEEFAEPAGIRLHRLTGLEWIGFPRSETPVWHDQVTATLRAHGITLGGEPPGDGPLIAEVKFAAVRTGRAFALAPPQWAQPLPEGVTWQPLIGTPIVRRTWAVWLASSRRRDVAVLVAALDLTKR